jgi:predicted SAM-dependent methyltransferase
LKGCEIKEEKLNLCCGIDIKEGWVNADLYPVNDQVVHADMRNLPREWTDRFDEILVSQSLEHISFHEVPQALENIRRVLKPAGKCVFIVPDLEWGCETFFSSKEDTELKAWAFLTIFGKQDQPGEIHKCGFTEKTLLRLLKNRKFEIVGFMAAWTNNQKQFLAHVTKKEADRNG